MGLLGAASTAAAVANVTNASFKSSTVPLQTILFACEPSERKSKDSLSELFAEIRATLYVCILAQLSVH